MHCYACESSWLILILSGKSECCVWKGTSGEVLSYKGNGAIGCHQYGTLLAVSECDSGAEQLGAARVVQTAQLDASGHEDCSDIRRSTAESRSALHANATACVGGTRTTMSELMASSQALSLRRSWEKQLLGTPMINLLRTYTKVYILSERP